MCVGNSCRRNSARLKGASVRKLLRFTRWSTCKSMFSGENLTLRVDKRSLCRNCIFLDECKHRSECARSKKRRLCAVTSSRTAAPFPHMRETQILKYFPEALRNTLRIDVTVFRAAFVRTRTRERLCARIMQIALG